MHISSGVEHEQQDEPGAPSENELVELPIRGSDAGTVSRMWLVRGKEIGDEGACSNATKGLRSEASTFAFSNWCRVRWDVVALMMVVVVTLCPFHLSSRSMK